MSDNEDLEALLPSIFSNSSHKNEIFSKLHERFCNLVRHHIWNAISDPDQMKQDVEDVVQEIMLAIDEGIRAGKVSGEKIVPWAIRITRNKINDYFRRKLNKNFDHLQEDPPGNEMIRPDKIFEKAERLAIIRKAISKLDSRDQRIIQALMNDNIKFYIRDEAKKIPVETVYVHIHRCRKRFEKILQKEGIVR